MNENTTHLAPEYGARGRVGIGVPQANSTVEPELRQLLPQGVEFYSVRLYSAKNDEAERIKDYLPRLSEFIEQFSELKLDCFGFAITGATYLAGTKAEGQCIEAAEQRFGIPIITTARALTADLRALGAKRIQLLSPYPAFLTDAAKHFWESNNIEVVRIVNIGSSAKRTHEIYNLRSAHALEALREAPGSDVDAIVCSGTGLPTVSLLRESERPPGPPILTSTLSLTNALLSRLELPPVTF